MIEDVPTFAELRGLPAPSPGKTVFVRGYRAPGDDGRGLFTFFVYPPGQAPPDDDGTILTPSIQPTNGRWRRAYTGWLNAKWFGAWGDGEHNDQPFLQRAVKAADGAVVFLPAGDYRLESSIVRRASAGDSTDQTLTRPGMRLVGENKDRTRLLSAVSHGPALRWDVAKVDQDAPKRRYTIDSLIESLTITMAADGPKDGADGIWLVAAWSVRLSNVQVLGMSGSGLVCPPRGSDPLSDPYQCWNIEIDQCWFRNCARWGIEFVAGQSPALFAIRNCCIQGNANGGIVTQTGQFEIMRNLIGENASVGLKIDTKEGPAMVALIAQNEFDLNRGTHLWIRHAQSIRVVQNRFISSVIEGKMTPKLHVLLGDPDEPSMYSLNGTFEQNYHRSTRTEEGPDQEVFAYLTAKSSADTQGNRFIDNQISEPLNSRLMQRYAHDDLASARFDNTRVLTDNDWLKPGLVHVHSPANTHVLSSETLIEFGQVGLDPWKLFDFQSRSFLAPFTGAYLVSASVTLEDLDEGTRVLLKLVGEGGEVLGVSEHVARGQSSQEFRLHASLVTLRKTQPLYLYAVQDSGNPKKLGLGHPNFMQIVPIG